ncbi:MAG: relaxase/mobilization nuclease domain-containing protein [Candidatus Thiodiazotropha weberae]|nr:relaxase/mobilization nuclease domain-containing protein [Candidatus Thiodiazotropha lotti]MCG8011412.1 relaxase/mobilization nuclease domain-containing protein [Candidatus Thiodiazotropha lotti]MCG8020900.1 relaxase/mobilization nuclease domain-containing protein [Candidatus Thiodiazotropha lotti]MCW4208066.1 relaxase/mobilization nuclease domain-containing protein [Candidatus Thiodiazotropha lotti]MCW4210877.1 relaxase/mobilization nuclease domain-containing protein [Candidatus Thiodiazotr
MITKHVPMRSLGKSDFAGLVDYITDEQRKEHRLGEVRLTNCEACSLRDAISEVLATQFANTRAKSDKTYHLIISFRAGEQINASTLAAIEDHICKGLGFGEHQRISAVHHDTDNLHIHIAINKIHPIRNTIHEPYYPHHKLAELSQHIERDYGLQQDNHTPRRRGAESRASDMEHHAGVESLIGWIKRECLDDIKEAQSWEELHQVMRDNGLELRTRGNGLIVAANDGTMIKASTLGRNFSKPKLEARFGPYEHNQTQKTKPCRKYRKDPIRLRVNTTELYARYKAEQQVVASNKTMALSKAKQGKDSQIAYAKTKGKARRAVIKLAGGGRLTKKLLYTQASSSLKTKIDKIQQHYRAKRQAIHDTHRRLTWADWLKQKALKGDKQALNALRAREAAQGLKGNTIKGRGRATPGLTPVIDSITKKGTIIYRSGTSAVRDDGDKLQVSRQATGQTVAAALRMTMERYGNRIIVNGSPEFKAQAIQSAVDSQLPITFADPGLEQRRKAMQNSQTVAKSKTKVKRPGIPLISKLPPSHRRNGLRTLSQLEVMRTGAVKIEPIPDKQEQRRAKIQAELAAKKAKRNNKGLTL